MLRKNKIQLKKASSNLLKVNVSKYLRCNVNASLFNNKINNYNKLLKHNTDEIIGHKDTAKHKGINVQVMEYHDNGLPKIVHICKRNSNILTSCLYLEDGKLSGAYEYNAIGKLTKEVHLYNNKITRYAEYQYDDHNNMTRQTRSEGGKITYNCIYKYDDNGNRVKEIKRNSSGNIEELLYDSSGELISRRWSDSKGTWHELEHRRKYDENGNLIKISNLRDGVTETEEDYIYNCNELTKKIYYNGGVKLYEETYEYRNDKKIINRFNICSTNMSLNSSPDVCADLFILNGRYTLQESNNIDDLKKLIWYAESIIDLLLKNNYCFITIHCSGEHCNHDCIASYSATYTSVDAFKNNAINDYYTKQEGLRGWDLDFSKIEFILKGSDIGIRIHVLRNDLLVQVASLDEDTCSLHKNIMYLITDTIDSCQLNVIEHNVKKANRFNLSWHGVGSVKNFVSW